MAFKKAPLHSQQALFSSARIFLHPAVTPAAQPDPEVLPGLRLQRRHAAGQQRFDVINRNDD